MTYTKEDFKTDTEYLIGQGMEEQEAKDFLKGLMKHMKGKIK